VFVCLEHDFYNNNNNNNNNNDIVLNCKVIQLMLDAAHAGMKNMHFH